MPRSLLLRLPAAAAVSLLRCTPLLAILPLTAPAPGFAQTPERGSLPAIDQHLIGRMLLHHAGGIALADDAIPRLRDPRLRGLAAAIRQRQQQEQALLVLWYRIWFDRAAPSWRPGALELPGLVLDPGAIATASDSDRAFVAQAVPYLRFGLMMALQAQVYTSHRDLLVFEQRLVERQSAEIRALEAWAPERPAP